VVKVTLDGVNDIESRKSHAVMAYQMATVYNKKCVAANIKTTPIFYVPPIYFKIKDDTFMGWDTLYAESCIA
jgi:hypothetical protein